ETCGGRARPRGPGRPRLSPAEGSTPHWGGTAPNLATLLPLDLLHLLEVQRIPRPLPEARNLRRDHRGSIPHGRNGDGSASLERMATRPSRAAARPYARGGPGNGGRRRLRGGG